METAAQDGAAAADLTGSKGAPSRLWVDKYSPRSFLELLSDEKINRSVLSWLKEWDGVVFQRDVKPSVITPRFPARRGGRGGFGASPGPTPPAPSIAHLVSPDRKTREGPTMKTILISGNPGIGKTTLAKIIARHCGYEPVEFNASDDRGASTFLPKVLDVVENSSVLDEKAASNSTVPRPKCLVIDEIDGVVGGEAHGAIKGLINLIDNDARASKKFPATFSAPAGQQESEESDKFTTDEADSSAKGGATAKKKPPPPPKKLKRPIICICNDPWVPALRALREKALIFKLEPPSLNSLLTRLQTVCRAEGVRVDSGFLQALAELTNRDIRACLNTLQFLSSKSKVLTPDMLGSAAVGTKDIQASIFDIWRSIFVKEQKNAFLQHVLQQSARREAAVQEAGAQSGILPAVEQAAANPSAREQQLFTSVAQGDVDRIVEGCWENYAAVRYSDPLWARTAKVAAWFDAVSMIWQEIRAHQAFSLGSYLPAVAIAVHQQCSVSFLAKQPQPPRIDLGFRPKREHLDSIVKAFCSGVSSPPLPPPVVLRS